MSELPTRDEFAAQEGTKFQLYLNPEENIVVESKPEKTIGLELIEITEVKKTPAVESFSLAFLAAGMHVSKTYSKATKSVTEAVFYGEDR